MISEIISKLLENEQIKDIRVYSKEHSEFFTHIIIAINQENVSVKKILYDKKSDSIFQELDLNEPLKIKKQKPTKIDIDNVKEIHKDAMIRLVNGALKSCINNHGDITKKLINSASKRITTNIFDYLNNNKQKKEGKNEILKMDS